MRRCSTPEEMFAAPVGASLMLASCAVCAPTADLIAAIHTGAFDPRDADPLLHVLPVIVTDRVAPKYDLLHDVAALTRFDEGAYLFFEKFLVEWTDQIAPRTRKLGVVRPLGLAGAAFTGLFHDWVVPRFDSKLCTSRAEVYEFLGLAADTPARAALDAIDRDRARSPWLRRVREALLGDVREATVPWLAAVLATSTRTLQRELAAHGTSFRAELAGARVRVAEGLLLDSDAKVEHVALEVGFSTPAAFHRTFTRIVGESPSVFRARGLAARRR